MGLQSGINSLIGAAGTAAALTDLSSSTKSTAKTAKELGVDSKMSLKAQEELRQKLDAIRANTEHMTRARMASLMNAQIMDTMNKRTAQAMKKDMDELGITEALGGTK